MRFYIEVVVLATILFIGASVMECLSDTQQVVYQTIYTGGLDENK